MRALAWLAAQRVLLPASWHPRDIWRWLRSESKLDAFCRATGVFCLVTIPVPNLLRAFTDSPWYGLLVPYGLFLGWFNLWQAEQGDRKTRHRRSVMAEYDRIQGMIAETYHLDSYESQQRQIDEIDRLIKANEQRSRQKP